MSPTTAAPAGPFLPPELGHGVALWGADQAMGTHLSLTFRSSSHKLFSPAVEPSPLTPMVMMAQVISNRLPSAMPQIWPLREGLFPAVSLGSRLLGWPWSHRRQAARNASALRTFSCLEKEGKTVLKSLLRPWAIVFSPSKLGPVCYLTNKSLAAVPCCEIRPWPGQDKQRLGVAGLWD